MFAILKAQGRRAVVNNDADFPIHSLVLEAIDLRAFVIM